MEAAHTRKWEDVVQAFRVDPKRGLSEDDVKRAREEHGPKGRTIWWFL